MRCTVEGAWPTAHAVLRSSSVSPRQVAAKASPDRLGDLVVADLTRRTGARLVIKTVELQPLQSGLRHLPPFPRSTPSRPPISPWCPPSAAASTIRDRNASA
jgi:hypothetical protein